MISITVNSSERTDIISYVYKNVISVCVFSHQGKSKCIYECYDVGLLVLVTDFFWRGEVRHSTSIIIINFM
jgi:hypothetical protein